MIKPMIKRRLPNESLLLPSTLKPELAYVYARRPLQHIDEITLHAKHLMHYQKLSGIENAVECLYDAIIAEKNIVVVGDFDTDGATSTALMVRALRGFGVKNVSYIIPDRFDEGYGLSKSVVDRALQNQAHLIITVDNGISANEAVAYAKQHKIKVVITDHHLVPSDLPHAEAIVNPQLPSCEFPSKNLAGVGVAFYVMIALRTHLREKGWFIQQNREEFNLAQLLDLVAVGTVADLVSLDYNNRILVQQGVMRIRQNRAILGIHALLQVINKPFHQLSTQDIAFYLAPRLNAAGRMDNMSIGVELLLTDDFETAIEIAHLLNDLNLDRKTVEASMRQEALSLLEQQKTVNNEEKPNSLVIYDPSFHEGVIGLLSSRLKEQFYRPVFSFARNDSGLLKGSGRSIPSIHLRDCLEAISHRAPSLLIGFGGHAMAAGLTIKEDDLSTFKTLFAEEVDAIVQKKGAEILLPIIETDGELPESFFNYESALTLKLGLPWGSGFPEPIFDGEFKVIQQKLIGKEQNHLKFLLSTENGLCVEALLFYCDRALWPDLSVRRISIIYTLDPNTFRDQESITLLIQHLEIVDE